MLSEEDLRRLGVSSAELVKILAELGIPAVSTGIVIRYLLPTLEQMLKKGASQKEIDETTQSWLKSEAPRKYREAYDARARARYEAEMEISRNEDLYKRLGSALNDIEVNYTLGKLKKDEYDTQSANVQGKMDAIKQRIATIGATLA
jgi:hypothetical protein